MKTLTLFLTHSCNQRCLFCCDRSGGADAAPLELAEARDECAKGYAGGARRLVLLGGEPTLYAPLAALLRYARNLGFAVVQIVTNGTRLADKAFTAELRDAGLAGVGLSVHGATLETHDHLTQSPGSFHRIMAALDAIASCNMWVSTNTVVTRTNVGELDRIVDLLLPFTVVRMQFAIMNPQGGLRCPVEAVALSPIAAAVPMSSAAMRAKSLGLLCMIEALPLCLMPNLLNHAAESSLPTLDISDPPRLSETRRFHWRSDKGYGPSCSKCAIRGACSGTYPQYFDLFPELAESLRPFDTPPNSEPIDEANDC